MGRPRLQYLKEVARNTEADSRTAMKRMACNKSRWKAANQSKDWGKRRKFQAYFNIIIAIIIVIVINILRWYGDLFCSRYTMLWKYFIIFKRTILSVNDSKRDVSSSECYMILFVQ